MKQIRKILVPIDFSECARHALAEALEMAKAFQAQITLLHVEDLSLPPGELAFAANFGGGDLVAKMLAESEALLAAEKKAVAEVGVPIETQHGRGVPYAEIVRIARIQSFDLIVMGTHGRTGLKHVLIGSVAERVVRLASCPVLTVRPPGFRFESI